MAPIHMPSTYQSGSGQRMSSAGPKFSLGLQEKICAEIASGCETNVALDHLGVSKGQFYGWMRRGAREKAGLYAKFNKAIKRAIIVGAEKIQKEL